MVNTWYENNAKPDTLRKLSVAQSSSTQLHPSTCSIIPNSVLLPSSQTYMMDFTKDEQSQPLTRHTDESEDDCESLQSIPERRHHRSISPYCIGALFVICTIISGLFGAYIGRNGVNFDQKCAAHTTQYSSVLRDVDIKYSMTHFNGSFMQETIYRRPGSPEVDEAWEALGVDYRPVIIPQEDGPASGLSKYHVQRAKKYGGGYLANVEGMHHLHCLNLLRKSLYFNFDHYKALGQHAFMNDNNILQLHVTHCLDTIRQVLMCNVDTGVLGQVWVSPEKPAAFPDFNTQHMCKNYEKIRQWAGAHQAPPVAELPDDYLAAPEPDGVYAVTP